VETEHYYNGRNTAGFLNVYLQIIISFSELPSSLKDYLMLRAKE